MSIRKDFDIAERLYIEAFPFDERRSKESIKELLEEEYFEFIPIFMAEEFVGFATLWIFENFAYIEHFAIDTKKRNMGIGFDFIRILQGKEMKNFNLTFTLPTKKITNIALEVEIPNNEIAKRRVHFYERLDFRILDNYYFQPPYSKDSKGLEMKVMLYSPNNEVEFNQIKSTLYKYVYKV